MAKKRRPDHDPGRRRLLEQSLALAGTAAVAGLSVMPPAARATESAAPGSDPHPARDRRLSRIAFGCCAEQDRPQPVWDPVLARQNDLFIFLGDNIYADTRDMAVMKAKYAKLAAQPGFKRLRETTPLVAMWDDHDFGENDAGGDYPMKEASRQIFLDFWAEPAGSPRRGRDGVYASYVFGPPGERVQVILPDLRFNRTAMTPMALQGAEYEAWANFARDQDRLFDVIRRKRANGVLFLSGDIHYAELSKLDVNVPYPLWDLTSSGLTEEWRVPTPNANRASEVVADANFGWIDIDWQGAATVLTLGITDATGRERLRWKLPLAELAVPA